MHSYKWQIILDPTRFSHIVPEFKIGDLVTLSGDVTVDMIIRDIHGCRAGLVTKIRYFSRQEFHQHAKEEIVCEYEIFWSPNEQITYETKSRLIKL